jgi:hypothetical protein
VSAKFKRLDRKYSRSSLEIPKEFYPRSKKEAEIDPRIQNGNPVLS